MPSSPSRPGRRPDPATHHRWQQCLDRFRNQGLVRQRAGEVRRLRQDNEQVRHRLDQALLSPEG